MKDPGTLAHEQDAAIAFSKQAPVFDATYAADTIFQYKRKRVREHVLGFLPAGSHILELNAGTGDDAIFFAEHGHEVHATDISTGMQTALSKKVIEAGLQSNISNELCSFTELPTLKNQGPFDLIFSNFAGLNCTDKLEIVLASFSKLLKPGGFATLVILPKFCLWELLLMFKGKFRTAFRRFSGRRGTRAHIEGEFFRCWYYNPSFVKKQLKKDFRIHSLEGLCTLVPPSYIEHFAEKHPLMYKNLTGKEERWKASWPWRSIGDYYIITMQKKP